MGIGKSIQNAGKWIFNIKEEERIRVPVDESQITENKVIRAQQQQISGLQAQLARVSATEKEKKEAEKAKDYKEEIAKRLQKFNKEIKNKRFDHTFSFRYFFNKIGALDSPSKFGKSIEITDKDDKKVFGNFGDIVVTDGGYFVITDTKGNIIHYSKDMNSLVWKPDALANYVRRKRIPVALDEDGNPVIDLEELESPDIIYDDKAVVYDEDGNPMKDKNGEVVKGEYLETREFQKPIRVLLMERDERMRDIRRYAERLEKLNLEKDHTIQNLNRTLRMLENRSDLAQSELSKVVSKAMQFENVVGDMQSKIVKLSELKALHENQLQKMEYIVKGLLDKLEKAGDKTAYELAKNEVKQDMEDYKTLLPEIVNEIMTHRTEERAVAQPGRQLQPTV